MDNTREFLLPTWEPSQALRESLIHLCAPGEPRVRLRALVSSQVLLPENEKSM